MDKDYRSLEHKIRDVVEASMNRNTELRRKVVNVGRPDTADSNFDPKSKLAKQGEIKTKIIDEAGKCNMTEAGVACPTHGLKECWKEEKKVEESSHTDKDKKEAKKDSDKDDKESKAGASKAEDEFTGGKTEVDFEPKTNDKTTIDSDDKSKKTKKVTKEETMLKSDNKFGLPQDLIDAVTEAMMKKKPTEEELKGDQHKIDKNKNGKIDAHDFKLLRKEETEELEEAKTNNEGRGYHGEAQHAAKGEDKVGEADKAFSKAHSLVKKHAAEHLSGAKNPNKMVTHYLDSKHGRHLHGNENNAAYVKKDFGHFKKGYKPEMHEEVEQVDEVSKKTLSSYVSKAAADAANKAHSAGGMTQRYASEPVSTRPDNYDDARKKATKRLKGIDRASARLAKEDVELSAEEIARIEEIAKGL